MPESNISPYRNKNGNESKSEQNGNHTITDLLDRVVENLNTTRRNCRTERVELTESVESQLRDMRVETQRIRGDQQAIQHEVRALQEKLQSAAIHRAGATAGSADRLSLHTVARTAQKLHRDVQQALSEVGLLKASVFHDGLVREERQRVDDAEDELVEARLRLAEEANDEMRRAVVRLQAQKKQIVSVLQSTADSVAQWMPRAAQREAQVERITEAFERLQAEQAQLAGIVESVELSCEQYKATHDETLARLERTVIELEKQFQQELSKKPLAAPKYSLTASHDQRETTMTRSLKQRLEHFYSIYNPAKIASVEAIIDEYAGAEEELMAVLEVHYGAFGFFSYH